MSYKLIETFVEKRIGHIFLNRPDKRNALNSEIVTELKDAFIAFENNDEVKVIVLGGNGDAFCAGADLGYLQTLQNNTYEENLEDSSHLMSLFDTIYHLKKVVIALVEGHAIAGGAGLATVCDMVFSVPEAKMGYTEVKIGFIPAIVSIFLLRKIGESKSKDLLLSGRLIDATEAKEFGMVNFIHSKETIREELQNYLKGLIKGASGQSLELTKRLIFTVQDTQLKPALEKAAAMNADARATADCKKGIASFLNKEKITW